ncbi:MAG: dipeptidase [Geoalkalibacter sp.]|uniref:dipeptidase n=1 Tax=Geoalkalibacter sp. TaxID=3041440 RepID=UPI002A994375|nr:membrane dipeptidase [Thermodesulfobacteriota bacterium]
MSKVSGRSRLTVADGHVDLIYMLEGHAPDARFLDLRQGVVTPATLAQGRVILLVCALYCEDIYNGIEQAWPRLQNLMRQADRRLAGMPRFFSATEPEDPRRPAVAFLLENSDALLEADWEMIEDWGLRVAGLTHAGSNRLADGNAVSAPQGVTELGRSVVKKMAARGWCLDLAHLSPPAFYQALDLYDGQVFSSHTGLRRFCDRARNLDEEQLRVLVSAGGIVGLSPAPEMLTGGAASFEDMVVQVDWLVQRFGPKAVALGSDYGGFEGACHGLEDHSCWPKLANSLAALGYPAEATGDILGGNWLRVYDGLR